MSNKVIATETLYAGWKTLLMVTMETLHGKVDRLVFEAGSSACVLPYDPDRKTVIIVSQSRAPLSLRGEPNMFEAIAGGVEDESPDSCARREAREEAGLQLGEIEHIADVWPSPGVFGETIDCYLSRYSNADRVANGGGLVDEAEHVDVHEIGFDELRRMYEVGEIRDAKLLILVQALMLRQPQLFGG